jgi:hypothetical protein
MGDYIYILILVAWVGFTLYNRSRKTQNEHPDKPRPQSWFERSLEEMIGAEQSSGSPESSPKKPDIPLIPERKPSLQPSAPVQKMTSFEKEYSALGIYSIEEDEMYKGIEPIQMSMDDMAEHNYNEDILSEEDEESMPFFDLRQAMIYTAILNRPYD